MPMTLDMVDKRELKRLEPPQMSGGRAGRKMTSFKKLNGCEVGDWRHIPKFTLWLFKGRFRNEGEG
jgi:hypothetical protein